MLIFRHAFGKMILLQAISCYSYCQIHWIKLSEHVHAGRHHCVCKQHAPLAWGCVLISGDWSEGRCWQRLEDRWWWVVGLRSGRIGGPGCGPDLVLAVMKEKQTDLTVTNEASLLFPTASFPPCKLLFATSVSPPCSPSIFFSTPIFFIFTYQALFQPPFPLSYFFSPLLLFSPWCFFSTLPPTIAFFCTLFALLP